MLQKNKKKEEKKKKKKNVAYIYIGTFILVFCWLKIVET